MITRGRQRTAMSVGREGATARKLFRVRAAGRDDIPYEVWGRSRRHGLRVCGVEGKTARPRKRAAPHRRAGRPDPPPRCSASLLAQQRAARCRRESRSRATQSRVVCQCFRRAAAFAACGMAAWRARYAYVHAATPLIGAVEEYRRATGEGAFVELHEVCRGRTTRCARGSGHGSGIAQTAQPLAQRLRRHLPTVGRCTQSRALALRAGSILERGATIGRAASIQITGCSRQHRGEQSGGRDHKITHAAFANTARMIPSGSRHSRINHLPQFSKPLLKIASAGGTMSPPRKRAIEMLYGGRFVAPLR